MKTMPCQTPSSIELLCFSVGGVKIGADSSQIMEMCDAEGNSDGDDALLDVELLPEARRVPCAAPTVLVVPDGSKRYRLVVEQPEELVTVFLRDIRPFPPLIERFVLPHGFWGVFPFRGSNYLLLDLVRLSRSRATSGADSRQRLSMTYMEGDDANDH